MEIERFLKEYDHLYEKGEFEIVGEFTLYDSVLEINIGIIKFIDEQIESLNGRISMHGQKTEWDRSCISDYEEDIKKLKREKEKFLKLKNEEGNEIEPLQIIPLSPKQRIMSYSKNKGYSLTWERLEEQYSSMCRGYYICDSAEDVIINNLELFKKEFGA